MHWKKVETAHAVTCALIGGSIAATAHGGQPEFSVQTDTAQITMTQIPADELEFAPMNVGPMMGSGATGDFNNDGLQDLYIAAGGETTDRLYINNGDGTFSDRTVVAGMGSNVHVGLGVAIGDYDNNGYDDIFVVSWGQTGAGQAPDVDQHQLWRNNGDGTFAEVAVAAGVNSTFTTAPSGWGAAFGDYDLDGDLDLAVTSWTGGGTRLFKNNGDGTFDRAEEEAGLTGTMVQGFSPTFVDMNNDLYPELLIAADYGGSRYYVNNGDGTFTDATEDSGTGQDGNGMGQAIGDLDRDGRIDWYVTSIFTPYPTTSVPGTGNFLYFNQGNHTYTAPQDTGSVDGGWGWGSEAVDVDHDGELDLVETNGWPMVNGINELEWINERCYVFQNQGDGTFLDIAEACGFDHDLQGRGLLRLDYDNDGDQDFLIFAFMDDIMLLRNDLVPDDSTHWLRLGFETGANPRLAPRGVGTRIIATAGKSTWTSILSGGATFLGQSELTIHLGLGEVAQLDELRVFWNDGTVSVYEDVSTNQFMTITAGNLSDLDQNGTVGFSDLVRLLHQWGQSNTVADLNRDGNVGMIDLDILLQNWS